MANKIVSQVISEELVDYRSLLAPYDYIPAFLMMH